MRVIPPNLALWLSTHVRAAAAAADGPGVAVDVVNREPQSLRLPLTKPLIVIRDDSGTRTDWTTFDRSIGASVLAGSREYEKPADDIALWLAGVLFDDGLALVDGSPIASVTWDGCNGPYPVLEELDVARRYLTAQYVATGSW